jgi:hypothetical protein
MRVGDSYDDYLDSTEYCILQNWVKDRGKCGTGCIFNIEMQQFV